MTDGPKRDRAAYMRDRRAQKSRLAETLGTDTLKGNLAETDQPAQQRKGYDCGCRPGNKCISHGIAAMSQKQRDAILDRINR